MRTAVESLHPIPGRTEDDRNRRPGNRTRLGTAEPGRAVRTSVVTPQPEDRPAEPAKARLLVSRSASAVTAHRIRKHPWRRTDPQIRRGFGCVDAPVCSHRRTGPVEAPIPGCSTYLPRLPQLAERIDDAGCHAMTVTPSARRPPQVTEAGNGVGAQLDATGPCVAHAIPWSFG